MWDERYGQPGFAYGVDPNDFLAAQVHHLHSPVICLASGEGRNAVFLATRGLEAHAVDASAVGVDKTVELAERRGVVVHTHHADLARFDLGREQWGGIVMIFAHLSQPLRREVHRRVVAALKPGGALVMEAYTPRQLQFKTGGPPVLDMLYTKLAIQEELEGLTWLHAEEVEREVHEGQYHHGPSAVLQLVGLKP